MLEKVRLAARGLDGPERVDEVRFCSSRTCGPGGGGIKGVRQRMRKVRLDDANIVGDGRVCGDMGEH
jgi:hypothetical protein